jgi:hypothetical protein
MVVASDGGRGIGMARRTVVVAVFSLVLAASAGAVRAQEDVASRELAAACVYDPTTRAVEFRLSSDSETLPDSIGAMIRRSGDRVVFASDLGPLECAGGTPTIANTDRIDVTGSGRLSVTLILSLAQGPLAPGATTEPEGASEIEVEVGLPVFTLEVRPGDGPDSYVFGETGEGLAANLNVKEASDDIDLVLPARPRPSVQVGRMRLGFDEENRGADRISFAGGAGTGEEFPFGVFAVGGAGADRIIGGPARDVLRGGQGRDTIHAASGNDIVIVEGGQRDRVNCGPGKDVAEASGADRLRACEKTAR